MTFDTFSLSFFFPMIRRGRGENGAPVTNGRGRSFASIYVDTVLSRGRGGKRTREWMCVHHGEEPHGVCTVAGKHCNPVTLRGLVERGAREREKLGWWRRGEGMDHALLCAPSGSQSANKRTSEHIRLNPLRITRSTLKRMRPFS